MQTRESKSFSELVSELQASAEEVASLAKNSEYDREVFTEFAVLLEKFTPILIELKENGDDIDRPTVRKAVESLKKELRRAMEFIKSTESPFKRMEDMTQDLGRSLGLVLFASIDVSQEIKEKVAALHKELMNAKFSTSLSTSPCPSANPSPRPSQEPWFANELDSQREIKVESIVLSIEDVVLQLKYGNDEEFTLALWGMRDFIKDQTIDKEWINDEGVIPILFNRLGSIKPDSRLTVIHILRILASVNTENKEKMADFGSLSLLVKSLTQEVEEQREAVGLLLELSVISAVPRRIGRIQGCIFVLVAMLNGDDPTASHNAGELLTALSSNTQNALYMAEAGYFKPLVHYLKEGSDMAKVLMATAIARMKLTDQSRASLGEDGAIEPLAKMFKAGNLEAKLSALNALQNLSMSTENIKHLISSSIVVSLLQLLFSVTSVLMTLQEPASAILAKIAGSESVLVNQDIVHQILSLLYLSSPVVQFHLLQALNSIASHSKATKARKKMRENGAFQLLLLFLTETSIKNRTAALNLLYTLSKDSPEELMEQLGEYHVNNIVSVVSSSTSEAEKAAAIGILSNVVIDNKKATGVLEKSNLLPALILIMSSSESTSTPTTSWLMENIAGLFIHFTAPSDKKLQRLSAELGVIPLLVKLLSNGSLVAKCRAATSLAQLSQNSLALRKSRKSRWKCIPRSAEAFCEVHDCYCIVKRTFCLVKAGAICPLIKILEGEEREADEAVLDALATLFQDEIWESGSNYIARMSVFQAIIKILESGNVNAQEKALWILERIFRIGEHRTRYGESAWGVLIDLAQNGDPKLKSTVANVLAQLELLQA